MTREIQDKLFRIDANISRPGTAGEASSGLGLVLCKEFVEMHGGKIWVTSEEGKGSSFFFELPNKA
jgi:signal transduction histidine kinase